MSVPLWSSAPERTSSKQSQPEEAASASPETHTSIRLDHKKQIRNFIKQRNMFMYDVEAHTPPPRVSPHWPSEAAAPPPGCLSSPPQSCSPTAARKEVTVITEVITTSVNIWTWIKHLPFHSPLCPSPGQLLCPPARKRQRPRSPCR